MYDAATINPLVPVPTDAAGSAGLRLEGRIRSVQGTTDAGRKGELRKVAQEFEAVFIAHMLKVMRETIDDSGLSEGGFGKSIYTELFDQEVSLNMARRGALGISDLLYRSLSESVPSASTEPAQESSLPETAPQPPASSEPASPAGRELEISELQLPVHAPVSSAFGMRKDPFTRRTQFHKGVDLAAPEGMKVVSALPGTVISAGYEKGYGNNVVVDHGGGLRTRYGHLGSIAVSKGDSVASEEALGTVGSTGRSTGPHLHFEVIRHGRQVDPLSSVADIRSSDVLGKGEYAP